MKVTTQALSSSHNPLIKDVRRAGERGVLTSEGYAVCEGLHLFGDAVASGADIGAVLVSEEAADIDQEWPSQAPVYVLPRPLFRDIATTESPQGIVTLVRLRESSSDDILNQHGVAVLLDGIQDPGNAGAIVRAVEAFGGAGVVFLKNTVSPYNPKCLRAAAGSLFRVPFVNHPVPEAIRNAVAASGVNLYAAMPNAKLSIDAVDWSKPSAIVIGSEGRGVSSDWSSAATAIGIPTTGVESLNAAVAAAVILYEARQRTTSSRKSPLHPSA